MPTMHELFDGSDSSLIPAETAGVPLVGRCGEATIMRSGDDDLGKFRTCERIKGHQGRHMTTYCGKRRFWAANVEVRGDEPQRGEASLSTAGLGTDLKGER